MYMGTYKGNSRTSIYVIDKNYKIRYFNDRLHSVFPELKTGEICYQTLCQENAPCANCPLNEADADSAIFYNKLVQRWLEVSTGTIQWPGIGECNIIFCKEIQEGNKSLLYNLTNLSVYDELFELNLTEDTYKILYHLEGKYVNPEKEGCLSKMLKDVVDHMIHPDDREVFLEFWNLDNMMQRLMQADKEGELSGQFRKKLADGGYRWIIQKVVPVNKNTNNDRIIMCFIQDIHQQKIKELERKESFLEEICYDPLTGMYKRSAFFRVAEIFLASVKRGDYCLIAIDIEHFKLFNEWYGQKSGDQLLIHIGNYLMEAAKEDGVAGYMGDDDFCMILPNNERKISSLQNRIVDYINGSRGYTGFLPAFGIYAIGSEDVSVSMMYDRACIAMASVKGNYARRIGWYDAAMMQRMEENHKLLSEVQKALEQGEFTFYVQPKCNMATGKIMGLESLVRWIHPERGLVPPGEFLPLLERSGFIPSLDLYVWNQVCKRLRRWIDNGHQPIPISVNVSRVDIYTLDIVKCFKDLMKTYDLEPRLVEIEITESAYVEEYQIITRVVDDLRKAGFTVLMDDFGSGYSSLNMLKDVNIDILKIDMKFLEINEQSAGKGLSILEAITSMARLMEMRTIAEGVETKEQKDLLLDMGCIYGQGYYFYHPMPIPEVEQLLSDVNNIDFRGTQAGRVEPLRVKELMNEDLFSEIILNKILGGIAVYSMKERTVELLRVNEQYYNVVGTNSIDLEEYRRNILDSIYPDDQEEALRIFADADRDLVNGGIGIVRRIKEDGSMLWMELRAFFLKEQDESRLYYGVVRDVSEERKRQQHLEASQRALATVVHVSEKDESFMQLTEENRRAAAAIFVQMTPGGMIGGYCEDDFPLYFANYEMVKLLGYGSYDEFADAIDRKVINTIHPEDRVRVAKDIGPRYYAGLEYTTAYRMPKKDGTWFWTMDKGKVIEAEDGRLAIVSACTDISETMAMQEILTENNTQLFRKNQELNFLYNHMPGGYHRCAFSPGYEFIYISNRFLEIFGYTQEEIVELFDNKFINMVHPDDRKDLENKCRNLQNSQCTCNLEYRMLSKKGYIWVNDQSRYVQFKGEASIQGVILNNSEAVKLYHKMKLIRDYTIENIIIITWKNDEISYEIIANGLFREMGYSIEEHEGFLREHRYRDYLQEKDRDCLERKIMEAVKKRKDYEDVVQVTFPGKNALWLSVKVCYLKESSDSVVYLCSYSDITAIKEREQELFLLSEKMKHVLCHAKINSWEWDVRERRLIISNIKAKPEWTEVFDQLNDNTIVIRDFPECLKEKPYVTEESRQKMEEFSSNVKMYGNTEDMEIEVVLQLRENKNIWLRVVSSSVCSECGKVVKANGYFVDITEEKVKYLKSKESVKILERDALTGLYTRQAAIPKIKRYLQKVQERGAALIILDLDNFKIANDVFGHIYGDSLITKNAAKLKNFFRDSDIICRIGGDEFLVLCKNIAEEDVHKKLSQIVKDMVIVSDNGKRKITFTVSIGYVMIPEQGIEFDELYRKADIALFTAKMEGKRTFKKYHKSMKEIRYELAER